MLQDSPMYAYIPASDMTRARQFYERKVGLKPVRELAGGVVYEFGDHTSCFLYPTPNAGTSKASQAFWQVADVEREVSELKSRGVTFEEYDMPGLKTERHCHRRRSQGRVVQGHRGQYHGDHSESLVDGRWLSARARAIDFVGEPTPRGPMRSFVVRLMVLSLIAVPIHAQSVPAVSVEFTGGSASHTDRTSHTYYKTGGATFLRLAGTVRLWKPAPIAPVLTYEYATGCGLGWGCGDDAVCYLAPDNSCYEDFVDPKGNALGLGVSGNYRGYVIGTIGAGKAWYFKNATFVDANVALSVFSHVAFVADARHIMTRDVRGDRVWLNPISFGVRVQ